MSTAPNLEHLASRVQKYVNHKTASDAIQVDAYDMVQVKFDGWWSRTVIGALTAEIYSRQNQLKDTREHMRRPDTGMVLIGEFLRGTNRSSGGASASDNHGTDIVMVFDVIHADGIPDIRNWSYRERLNWLALQEPGHNATHPLPEWCKVVSTFELHRTRHLWSEHVVKGNAEGLVFRSSFDAYESSVIGRVKQEFSHDYTILGWYAGKGKRSTMAGGLIGGLIHPTMTAPQAAEYRAKYFAKHKDVVGFDEATVPHPLLVPCVRIGGGFNDPEMTDQATNFAAYRWRVLEVKGWQIFNTGAMRHPNAARDVAGQIRWRSDKLPADCAWPETAANETDGEE